MRPDRDRTDMEAFLHRLAHLESAGRISADARVRACREVRAVLTWTWAAGLTRPDAAAAGLGEDITLATVNIPVTPEPAGTCHLRSCVPSAPPERADLAGDGRRPDEICNLAIDCLAPDDDALSVSLYDNYKASRA